MRQYAAMIGGTHQPATYLRICVITGRVVIYNGNNQQVPIKGY